MVFLLSDPYTYTSESNKCKRMRSFCWHRQPYSSKVHAIAVSSFVSTYLISSDECNIITHSEYEMTNQRMNEWGKKTNKFNFLKKSLFELGAIKFSCWMAEIMKEARAQRIKWMYRRSKTWRKRSRSVGLFVSGLHRQVLMSRNFRWYR